MNGHKEYLETAWNEYREQLLTFIRRKIRSRQDADDILADVFLKLAKQTGLARIPHKLPNWLYRVTNNAIIDYYRVQRPLEALPQDVVQDAPTPEAMSTLSACIMPLLEQLPDTYRIPLLLSEIKGKRHRDVADELDLSVSAVKSRILRGRKQLKDIMAKRCTFLYDKHGRLVDYEETLNS